METLSRKEMNEKRKCFRIYNSDDAEIEVVKD